MKDTKKSRVTQTLRDNSVFLKDAIEQWTCSRCLNKLFKGKDCSRVTLEGLGWCRNCFPDICLVGSFVKWASGSTFQHRKRILYTNLPEIILIKVSFNKFKFPIKKNIFFVKLQTCICITLKSAALCIKSWQLGRGGLRWEGKLIQVKTKFGMLGGIL